MDEFNNQNVQDVDYIEVPDKTIRGEALYYSTNQVAKILDLSDSKVRYYTTVFADILNIEFHNKQRRFTKVDIDKLEFLVKLKNDGMTIKQIQEYCQEVDFETGGEIQIKESNPLSIQTLAKALLEQQQLMLEEFRKDLSEDIRKEVAITVDERLDEKLDNFKSDLLQAVVDQKELEFKQHDEILLDNLRKHMEENQKKFEEQQSKKSFWNRLFKR